MLKYTGIAAWTSSLRNIPLLWLIFLLCVNHSNASTTPLLRFDLTHCKWEPLPDMLCQRDYFSAVCVDGKVFAIGGNRDDSQYQDTVEYYTPEENAWRYGTY